MQVVVKPGETLKIKLAAAVTTNQPRYNAAWREGGSRYAAAPLDSATGVMTSDTAVSVIANSAVAGLSKILESLSVLNSDTVAVTLTIFKTVSAVDYNLAVVTLQSGDMAVLTPEGLKVLDSTGREKVVQTQGIEVTAYAASGAIAKPTGTIGTAVLTKAGVGVMTLAAPTAGTDDGKILNVISSTAQAHTLTITAGFNGGGAGADVGTFGGAIGDGISLVAYQGNWYVLNNTNVTLA